MQKKKRDILQANIERHLDKTELKALCFALKIDFNALDASGLANKTRALIAYCERYNKLSELLQELERSKPEVSWEEYTFEPPPDEYPTEEVIDGIIEPVDIEEAQFEGDEPAEEGISFSRTTEGEIILPWEDVIKQPPVPQTKKIKFELAGNFSKFALDKQMEFIHFIAKVAKIKPDQITILEVTNGSIKIIVEMPIAGYDLILSYFEGKDPLIRNFRVKHLGLVDWDGPPPTKKLTRHDIRELIRKPKGQELRQFIFLYFTDNGLRDLCKRIGTDYNSVPGNGKWEKAKNIIASRDSWEKYISLVELCLEKRPAAFLKEFPL